MSRENETGGYNGNPLLKKPNTAIEWDQFKIDEFLKCKEDPLYFAEQYIKIINVDEGFVNIKLYDYQKEIIETFKKTRKLAVLQSRQSGKCVTGDTKIKVRNKITGKVMECKVDEFFNEAKAHENNR